MSQILIGLAILVTTAITLLYLLLKSRSRQLYEAKTDLVIERQGEQRSKAEDAIAQADRDAKRRQEEYEKALFDHDYRAND